MKDAHEYLEYLKEHPEVCAEINRAQRAHIPNLLRANVPLRQVAMMRRCSRWSLKKYFCVNV